MRLTEKDQTRKINLVRLMSRAHRPVFRTVVASNAVQLERCRGYHRYIRLAGIRSCPGLSRRLENLEPIGGELDSIGSALRQSIRRRECKVVVTRYLIALWNNRLQNKVSL